MNNVESLLEHCHGEETHLSRNEGRTVSLSQMNNVESLLEHCHGEKTHFSRNEKRTFGMAPIPVGHNTRCCLPTQIPSAECVMLAKLLVVVWIGAMLWCCVKS